MDSPGNVPDLDRVGTRSRSGTNVPNQVTNLDFCSRVNLFEVGEPFSVVFLKYKILDKIYREFLKICRAVIC